jgi:hypothetical protein
MPWSPAQNRLFNWVANTPGASQESGIPRKDAERMAHEGIKKPKKGRPAHKGLYGLLVKATRTR